MEEEKWKKPVVGKYKYNIDASFSSSLNRVGLGMGIRNDVDEFALAKTDWFAPLCDVDVGEAVGLHTALQWVSVLQFDNVDFALDSKRVVDCVNSDVDVNSKVKGLILLLSLKKTHTHPNIRKKRKEKKTYFTI